jgi:Zn-dependent alcohol dehydrogenase
MLLDSAQRRGQALHGRVAAPIFHAGTAESGELLGPLGCGFQTGAGGVMRSLAATPGSSIAIIGGASVGLAAVMGAVIQQCATIVLVEPIAARRDQCGRSRRG